MKTYWLKLAKPCILELPPDVKDYAGQRLVFRPRDGLRRCVREDVFNHPLVQRYLAARYIELEGTPLTKAAPPPRPVKAAKPVVETTPEPVLPISEVVAAEDLVIAEVDVPEVFDEVAEPMDESVEVDAVEAETEAGTEPETRKKRKKSRRYE